MKGRSLAFPIFLIGAGALFLINNAMPELSVWHLLSDWWPVLLIAFGVIRLIEVLALYGTGRVQSGAMRPMGFGWIVGLVVIALAFSLPHHFSPHCGWAPVETGFTNLFGEDFDYPVSIESGVGTGVTRVVLDHMRGGITINGSDRADIQVNGHKTVHAYDRKEADKINEQALVTFSPEGDTIFIRAAEPSNPRKSRVSVDMEISIPKGLSVEARGRSGDLTINTVNGDVDVASQHGEVRLQDIGGSTKVDVDHCDLIRATNLKGNFDLQGNGGDVQLERVDGQVTINGRFSGTLDFKTLAKPLHFESEQTDLRVEKLPGTISMSLSELHGTNVSGPIHFVTHERDVKLEDYVGALDIELGHGDIELKPSAGAALAHVDVRSRSGNIDMALPTDKPFDLKATAQQGEVSNDFGDGIVSESGQGRTSTLHSANGSGPAISLVTERGEVSVRKLD